MKFRTKIVEVEAFQWFKNGDHPRDDSKTVLNDYGHRYKSEGRVVRYYRLPAMDGMMPCEKCGRIMQSHGWIDNILHQQMVCPGDWVVSHPNNIYTVMNEEEMEAKYERVTE